MNATRHYYKVTGKKLQEFVTEWWARYDASIDGVRRFSRRVGGHRQKIGISRIWGSTSISFIFKSAPDAWKKKRSDIDDFWIPKRTKAHKKLYDEFDLLEKAIPSFDEVSDAVKFKGFADTGNYWQIGVHRFCEDTLILVLPTHYVAPKGIGLRRISDVMFENLVAARKTV